MSSIITFTYYSKWNHLIGTPLVSISCSVLELSSQSEKPSRTFFASRRNQNFLVKVLGLSEKFHRGPHLSGLRSGLRSLGPPDLRPGPDLRFSGHPDLRPDLTCVFQRLRDPPDLRPEPETYRSGSRSVFFPDLDLTCVFLDTLVVV